MERVCPQKVGGIRGVEEEKWAITKKLKDLAIKKKEGATQRQGFADYLYNKEKRWEERRAEDPLDAID